MVLDGLHIISLTLILSLSITQNQRSWTWKPLGQTIPWPHPQLCESLSFIRPLLSTCSVQATGDMQMNKAPALPLEDLYKAEEWPCPGIALWSAGKRCSEKAEPEVKKQPPQRREHWSWTHEDEQDLVRWKNGGQKWRRVFAEQTRGCVCLGNWLLITQIFTEHLLYASLALGRGRHIIHGLNCEKLTRCLLWRTCTPNEELGHRPHIQTRSSQTWVLEPRDYIRECIGIAEKNIETSIYVYF